VENLTNLSILTLFVQIRGVNFSER